MSTTYWPPLPTLAPVTTIRLPFINTNERSAPKPRILMFLRPVATPDPAYCSDWFSVPDIAGVLRIISTICGLPCSSHSDRSYTSTGFDCSSTALAMYDPVTTTSSIMASSSAWAEIGSAIQAARASGVNFKRKLELSMVSPPRVHFLVLVASTKG